MRIGSEDNSNRQSAFLLPPEYLAEVLQQSRTHMLVVRYLRADRPGCARALPVFCWFCQGSARALPLPRLCPASAQPLPGLCPGFAQALPGLFTGFARAQACAQAKPGLRLGFNRARPGTSLGRAQACLPGFILRPKPGLSLAQARPQPGPNPAWAWPNPGPSPASAWPKPSQARLRLA